ncbi:MAG: tRNA lysidine(34) synthetase TilS [Cyclobacteriaceae bacterium]
MKDKFLKHLEGLGLQPAGDKLLLAVSGGLDSMVMLHLFQACGFSVGVAHVNFQLRGAESEGDEQFVDNWCAVHNIPFFVQRFQTNNYAMERKLSIQMAARELRYAWFDELLKKEGFRYVATAHHLNDSLETVLINLARGTGIEGMVGIPVKSGSRIRPLLFATKSEIENYAAEEGIAWREDSSNLTDDYQRNFIRHQIIPALKKVNPALDDTFKETVSKIRGELALLQHDLAEWKKEYWVQDGEIIRINKNGLSPEEGVARLWHSIKPLGFSYTHCEDILRALHGQSGKQFLTTTHKLVVDRDFLVITPGKDIPEDVVIEPKQERAVLGSYEMRIRTTHDLNPSADPGIALLDADKLKFPLIWRKWKAGDYFFPFGMAHRKKISDFLVDSKISLGEKDSVTVLESGDEIVWIVGHRIDNRYKLTPETGNALSLSIHPYLSQ